jgi:hypothetical protein
MDESLEVGRYWNVEVEEEDCELLRNALPMPISDQRLAPTSKLT